jgi:two-component system, chemotaxis family, sensor kinase CheA
MDELLGEFITETNEFLETVDNQLVVFEADPTDSATLNSIFRLVHTIKGTCGFLGLPRCRPCWRDALGQVSRWGFGCYPR